MVTKSANRWRCTAPVNLSKWTKPSASQVNGKFMQMRRTVSQDVDSFVVPRGQTFDATGTRGERTISADDVRVEFEMFRHLIPCEQISAFASIAFLTFLRLGSVVRSCKSVHVRRRGILAFGHHWRRRANGATKIARVTADQRLFNGRDRDLRRPSTVT